MNKSVPILFLLMLIPCISLAQEIGITGSSQFRRQLDSFSWNYETAFNRSNDTYSILFSNAFNSRFSLFNKEVRNIQDENIANLLVSGWLGSQFGWAAEARSYRFSNTNVKQDFAMAGLQYRLKNQFEVSGLAGFMQDERSQQSDRGWMLGVRGVTTPFQLGDFLVSSQVHVDYADISPRTSQTYRWNTLSFFEVDSFSLEGAFDLARNVRESYQTGSFFNQEVNDVVESIQNDTTGVQLSARFPLFDSFESRLDVNILTHLRMVTNKALLPDIEQTYFDTRILRQLLNLRFQTTIPWRDSRFILGFNYSIGAREAKLINTEDLSDEELRRRTDILINSNFDQTRFEMFTTSNIRLGERNTTHLLGNVSIMNYDTPVINKDDRDELFLQARIMNEHQFSEFFKSTVTVAGEAVHSVYLFAERSIENNWRRSIRLIPEFEWKPMRWLTYRQQFLVRANYTVEDFELPGRQKNDQVSREFGVNSQLHIQLKSDWSIDLQASRNELRIGRLLWEEFREIPTDTLITYDSRIMLTHQSGALLSSVGIRYFYKWDFLPRTTLIATDNSNPEIPVQRTSSAPGRQTTVQWGPMVQMRLPLYHRNELIINGWYQIQAIRQRLYTEYPEEFRALFQSAERKSRRQTYPNLEIIARFRF